VAGIVWAVVALARRLVAAVVEVVGIAGVEVRQVLGTVNGRNSDVSYEAKVKR
jgi:hypothetical protein